MRATHSEITYLPVCPILPLTLNGCKCVNCLRPTPSQGTDVASYRHRLEAGERQWDTPGEGSWGRRVEVPTRSLVVVRYSTTSYEVSETDPETETSSGPVRATQE